jgi:hypothetical protein
VYPGGRGHSVAEVGGHDRSKAAPIASPFRTAMVAFDNERCIARRRQLVVLVKVVGCRNDPGAYRSRRWCRSCNQDDPALSSLSASSMARKVKQLARRRRVSLRRIRNRETHHAVVNLPRISPASFTKHPASLRPHASRVRAHLANRAAADTFDDQWHRVDIADRSLLELVRGHRRPAVTPSTQVFQQ